MADIEIKPMAIFILIKRPSPVKILSFGVGHYAAGGVNFTTSTNLPY